MEEETALRCLQAVSFVWAGMVVGISFLEAPVKFTAPSVTRAIGLDVGRHVFAALNKVELGLAVLAFLFFMVGWPRLVVRWTATGVAGILLIQTVWLLPALRAQATAIIAGELEHGSKYVHVAYVVLEVLKVIGLAAVGWLTAPS